MIVDCIPVGSICVAAPYAAVAEADYALRAPGSPPPGPRIDETEATRLGVRIEEFSSDAVGRVTATRQNRRCVKRACVLVDQVLRSPSETYVSWGSLSRADNYASVSRSVRVVSASSATRDAAIAAVSLETGTSGVRVSLASVLKQIGR